MSNRFVFTTALLFAVAFTTVAHASKSRSESDTEASIYRHDQDSQAPTKANLGSTHNENTNNFLSLLTDAALKQATAYYDLKAGLSSFERDKIETDSRYNLSPTRVNPEDFVDEIVAPTWIGGTLTI